MAIKKTVILDVKSQGLDTVDNELKNVEQSFKDVKKEASGAGDSIEEVTKNGGAIAILDRLTGGLATQFRDAFEATKLFNFSLKGLRTALISTGIGALVVGVGLLVAYWDDIVDYIEGANKQLENQEGLINDTVTLLKGEEKLLESKEKLLEAEGKSTKKIREERKKIVLQQIEENQALINNLKLQLEQEKSVGRQLGLWDKIALATKSALGFDVSNDIAEQVIEQTKRESELANRIKEFEVANNDLRITLTDLNKGTKEEQESQKKRTSDAQKESDVAIKTEEKRQNDLKALKEKYKELERDQDAEAELEKINLEETRALERLEALGGNLEAEQAIRDYYAGERLNLEKETAKEEDEIKKDADQKEYERKLANFEFIANNDMMDWETRLNAINDRQKLLLSNQELTEEERTRIESEGAKARQELAVLEAQTKADAVGQYGQALQTVSDVVGQETAAGKALAVAASLVNTYSSIAGQLAAFSTVPVPGYAIAQAIATGVAGFAAVKKILTVKVPGGKGSGSGGNTVGGGIPRSVPPQFNVVGTSPTNQLAQTIGEQEQTPVKAFVVSTEMTTQQALDRNAEEDASF